MIKRGLILFIIILLSCLYSINKPLNNNIENEKVVLKFSSWGSSSEIKALKPLILEFERLNPDIKVEFLHFPQNYFQKIHLLFASNRAPDVVFINNLYLPIYADFLENLSNKVDVNPFFPKSLEVLSYNNNLYAIPRDISNLVIYYNKDLFDKKSVAYPNKDWTLNDLLEICQKLTDKNNFCISFEEDIFHVLPYLMSNGGGILSDDLKTEIVNDAKSEKSLEFYNNLRYKYHFAPLKSESATSTMAQMFLNQKIAMHLSGRWIAPKYRESAEFNWDIINFPSGDEGSIVQSDASGWAVSKNSKYKKEALEFINHLASYESITELTKSGLITPARVDVAKSPAFLNHKPDNSKVFIEIIETSKKTPVNKDYKKLTDKINKILSDKSDSNY